MQGTSSARQAMAQSDSINGRPYDFSTPSGTPDTFSGLEKGLDGEAQASKTLQRESSNSEMPARPAEPTPLSSTRQDLFPTPATRRRQSSFRERRALQTPGTLQPSPSKRLAYNDLSTPQNMHESNTRVISQETHTGQTSVSNSARFSFNHSGSIRNRGTSQSSGSFDALPSDNVDVLHSSIGSSESNTKPLQTVGGASQILSSMAMESASTASRPVISTPLKTIDSSGFGSRIALNGSSLRRQNSSAQQKDQTAAGMDSMPPPNGPTNIRARRKTFFPATSASANANIATMRAPRKSVGPGILSVDVEGIAQSHRRPTLAQAGLGEAASAMDSPKSLSPRNGLDASSASRGGSNRHNKTKSLQPPPRIIPATEQFYTPTGTPEQSVASPVSMARSPGMPNSHRMMTPSSSKRLSIMPGSAHATGLGARTISPTDARRLKRMSMMPNPPPMPFTPPTPQPDPPLFTERPDPPSPSMIPRKSVTPSSSRTTPDPNRKSYSSGVSNSSTTSYNSCLASSSSFRMSQNFSSSRLPTAKIRADNLSIGDDEIVPPVPAIPKAYESPKGEFEHPPFFSTRKSSLGHDTSSLHSTIASGEVPSPMELEPVKGSQQSRQSRAYNAEREPATERKPNVGAHAAEKRTLQPLRLPPLNLLPLSTPTSSKIAALKQATASKTDGTVTPPPRFGSKATPTTPMTASKASFSRNYYQDDNAPLPPGIRSSSSHYNMRPEALSYRAVSNSSTVAPNPPHTASFATNRTPVSPFVSSSLPKTSGDFSYTRLEKSNTFDDGFEAKPAKLTGPRLQKPRKASKDDVSGTEMNGSTDVVSESIGNSIRRKLSLTRKRSTSKAQTAAERDNQAPSKPPEHDEMPPPKLPASATWSGPLLASPSPSQRLAQSRATRIASNSSANVQRDRVRSSTWGTPVDAKTEPRPAGNMTNVGPKRTARATPEVSTNSNSLSLKDFLREAKTMDLTLDQDDLSAEDEMKTLASKRKETAAAAKEVDALRRRATAKERVGPNAALRMAQLNIFERGEIVDYKDVFFCGTKDAKKHVGDLSMTTSNFGYDDERGDYNIVVGDHLSYRYEIVDILGKGSFGQVVRCIDHKSGVLVAIKIIRNKKRFHQQALVEVEILQKLREWDPGNKYSMVTFVQSFYFRGHLCISTELLGMNLYEFIKCHDFRGFSMKLIRRFAKQLLSSLVLLKSKKVIHCDLKPENILLAHPTRSEIKVIDFGSSCHENEKVYTYIQSRFYRSPEVILGMTYGMPIDMWSLGCILAELLTGYPIFPGENEQEQLACIMEVFGPPEKHLIEKSTRKKLFFDSLGKPRITVSTKGKRRRPSSKSLQQALKCEDEAFLDFISRCLRWDPDRRLKPDEAIYHEFITGKITKNTTRPRTAPSNANSLPIKRYNSISQTPASTRPLPEPPVTSLKNATGIRPRDTSMSSQSLSKSVVPAAPLKRHSTMTGMQPNGNGAGVKRTLNGAALPGSGLPRVTSTARVGTGGGKGVDLAAAAAAASLKSK